MRGSTFTLAVVGVVATAATFALNAFQPSSINLHSHKESSHAEHHHAPLEVVDNSEAEFAKYVTAHGKSYATIEEYEFRYQQFLRTKEEIMRIQSMNSLAEFGVNQFSDWTEEEYKALLGVKHLTIDESVRPHTFEASNGPVDWRS